MNYIESSEIEKQIAKANNILINCHSKPDIDSVSSALALRQVLVQKGKNVKVICPDPINLNLSFIEGCSEIIIKSFDDFSFSSFDLFLLLDTADWVRATGKDGISKPNIKKIVIDHHKDNERYGDINLIDKYAGSTSEMLYLLFQDLEYEINLETGKALVSGMAGDSSGFRNTGASARTFKIVSELMNKGANKSQIITNIYGTMSLDALGLLGHALSTMKVNEKNKFVWSAINNETVRKYADLEALELYSGIFYRSVKETEFGLLFIERRKGKISWSVKSRGELDVSSIAKKLGGDGHKRAGGGTIKCEDFESKVEEMLLLIKESH